jgi:D-glycero-D-manno-heptose 1,7-bisphosphate phosphatase
MNFEIDKTWTLFLDRDGVINKKIDNDYVKDWNDFSFLYGSIEGIKILSNIFGKLIIVTNQRGVGKGLMTEEVLVSIHKRMVNEIIINGGKIDAIYYCTDESDFSIRRKPNIGMAIDAKNDFPDIDFEKSIMVGDSLSDYMFGQHLGMKSIHIGIPLNLDFNAIIFDSLIDFANKLCEK